MKTEIEPVPVPADGITLFGDLLTVEQLYQVYHGIMRIRARREDGIPG